MLICLSVLFSLNIFGQEGMQYVAIGMDVNGIEVGSKVTYKDVVSRFGVPDKFKTSDSEFGVTEDYYYKKIGFTVKPMVTWSDIT